MLNPADILKGVLGSSDDIYLVLGCIDEGCDFSRIYDKLLQKYANVGRLGTAGSGITAAIPYVEDLIQYIRDNDVESAESLKNVFYERVIEPSVRDIGDMLEGLNIAAVTSHPDCGAAAAVYKDVLDKLNGLGEKYKDMFVSSFKDADALGEYFAVKLSGGLSVEHMELTEEDMTRKRGEHHDTKTIYLDATGMGFDPHLRDINNGFLVTYIDDKHAEENVKLAIKLIKTHGPHEKIDVNNKINIKIVVSDMEEYRQIEQSMQSLFWEDNTLSYEHLLDNPAA